MKCLTIFRPGIAFNSVFDHFSFFFKGMRSVSFSYSFNFNITYFLNRFWASVVLYDRICPFTITGLVILYVTFLKHFEAFTCYTFPWCFGLAQSYSVSKVSAALEIMQEVNYNAEIILF